MQQQKPAVYKSILILIAYLIVAFIAYFPLLDNNYFSDDFDTMQRLTVQKQFWPPGFFRPLADAGLLFVYHIAGPGAGAQYLTAILMLGAGSLLFYLFSKSLFSKQDLPEWMHLSGGVLFLLYPFHFESLAWCVGRGSMQAALLAFWSLYIVLNNRAKYKQILLAQLLYFLALATYESVFVLPAVAFCLIYIKTSDKRRAFKISAWYGMTLLIHIALRIYVKGSIFGNYQQDGFAWQAGDYLLNYTKALSRTITLPLLNTDHFVIVTVCFFLVISFSIYKFLKQSISYHKLILTSLTACLLITLVTAAFFSVSVKTSEGDRLLFLPSIFIILILVFLISRLKSSRLLQSCLLALLTVYFCFNLYVQHERWNKASEIIDKTMAACKIMAQDTSKNAAILNLPDTYLGAYVYRKGFEESLHMAGIDSNRIEALAYFMLEDALLFDDQVYIVHKGNNFFIPGYARLGTNNSNNNIINCVIADTMKVTIDRTTTNLYYWNISEYKSIQF